MGSFLLIKRTPFKKLEDEQRFMGHSALANVRRPYMGIQAPKEERHATIVVLTRDGKKLDLLDLHSLDRNSRTKNYTNFIVQNMSRPEQEKFQIQETWGEDFLIVYGKKPVFIQVSGMLVSSANFPWEGEFWFNYQNLLRGTRLVEEGARIFMEIDNTYISGYMVNAQATKEVQVQNRIAFTFQLYVTNVGHYDTWQEQTTQLNLSPDSTDQFNFKSTNEVRSNLGEYAQLRSEGNADTFDSRSPRKWRRVRQTILTDAISTFGDSPHAAARAIGALPTDDLPDLYATSVGKGWSGGDPVAGKSVSKQKERGTWVDPYPNDKAGKKEFQDSINTLNDLTTPTSDAATRNMVGTARDKADRKLGRVGANSRSTTNVPVETRSNILSRTQQHLQDLSVAGPAFVRPVDNIINDGNQNPSTDGISQLQRRAVSVRTVGAANDVLNRHKPKTNQQFRHPRPGAFWVP